MHTTISGEKRCLTPSGLVTSQVCLSFLLLVSAWPFPILQTAAEPDLPPGYEGAPIAASGVKQKPAPAKGDQTFEVGGEAILAFEELLEETAADHARKKPEKKVDPRLLNLERQFRPLFQKLLKVERYRVHLVCDLSPERRRLLVRESDLLLNDIVRAYCLVKSQRRRGGQRQKPGLDPQQLIRDYVARLVREQFGPEETERYFDANRLDRDRRKRVTVLNLVAHIDRQLVLSDEQRERLTKNLTAHWQDAWGQALLMYVHGSQFLPRIPDDIVLPLLDNTQKTVWRGMPKRNRQVFFGNLAFGQKFAVVEEEVGSGKQNVGRVPDDQ